MSPRKAPAKTSRGSKPKSIQGEQFDTSDALHSYDDTYLMCRDLRHSWSVVGYFDAGGYVNRRLACSRCPTTRTDRLERRTGARAHPKYDYPDDYKIGGRVAASDVVREVLDRVTVYGSEEQLMTSMLAPRKRKRAS